MSYVEITIPILLLILPLLYLTSRSDSEIYSTFPRLGRLGFLSFFNPAVHDLVQEGYEKITRRSGKPFVVKWWAKDYILMPPAYLAELRGVDWSALSFFTNISDALFLHTSVGDMYHSDRMVRVVKNGVNPQLPYLTTQLLPAEMDFAIDRELAVRSSGVISSDGGGKPVKTTITTSVPVTRAMMAVMNRIGISLMISRDLARDEEFVTASARFVESIFTTALVIVGLPLGPFRSMLAPLLSLSHRYKLAKAARKLRPVVERRIAEKQQDEIVPAVPAAEASQKASDGIDWTLTHTATDAVDLRHDSPGFIAEELLHGLWAGSSAPGGLVANMIFQSLLLPRKECLDRLWAEAKAAVAVHGWSEPLFGALKLQDSFIREINRLFPTGAITCSRTVQGRRFVFSDGLALPPGSRFGFPIKAMQRDPAFFENPDEFDAFRFAKMDESSGEGKNWLASTVDTTNLAFGYGNHACPGRFLAVRMVKLIFTKLLLRYEFEWDSVPTTAPPPILVEGQFIPNMEQRVFFRPRH